jgi:hypothetical protein
VLFLKTLSTTKEVLERMGTNVHESLFLPESIHSQAPFAIPLVAGLDRVSLSNQHKYGHHTDTKDIPASGCPLCLRLLWIQRKYWREWELMSTRAFSCPNPFTRKHPSQSLWSGTLGSTELACQTNINTVTIPTQRISQLLDAHFVFRIYVGLTS